MAGEGDLLGGCPLGQSKALFLRILICYKGDWGTRLQENPQLILQFVVIIQLISRRILKNQNEAPEGIFYIIYQVYIPCVKVSVIGAILVCLSITLVILKQAQVALEHRYAVPGQKQSCPLTQSVTGILKEVILLHTILLQVSSTTFDFCELIEGILFSDCKSQMSYFIVPRENPIWDSRSLLSSSNNFISCALND